MKKILFIFFIFYTTVAFAADVDTVNTYSPSMKKEIKAVVITPSGYKTGGRFPVVYLLHGYSGNYADWIKKVPKIKDLADRYRVLIVCPDGNFNSWYLDSPQKPEVKYETYVAKELVNWIDQRYKTIADRKGRAITGLSMGGHGALYLAFKHQDVFSTAGSMSGGVDIRPFPKNWDIALSLGTYADQPETWDRHTVSGVLNLLTPNSLNLIIQCGTEDFFYRVNTDLHKKLAYRNIPHTFITNPGGHTWEYWSDAIDFQLLFITKHFGNGK